MVAYHSPFRHNHNVIVIYSYAKMWYLGFQQKQVSCCGISTKISVISMVVIDLVNVLLGICSNFRKLLCKF